MPRPLFLNHRELKNKQQFKNQNEAKETVYDKRILRYLRKKRSANYLENISKMDLNGQKMNNKKCEAFINSMEEEFSDVPILSYLEGIVGKCYLGDTYEVHALDLTGNIIEHYKKGQSMPSHLEKARKLAMQESYEFIEVYTDKLVAVDYRGRASIIQI